METRFSLGLLWLITASGWMFFVPWIRLCLWRRGCVWGMKRSFVDEYAWKDVLFQLQRNCAGILLGLFFIWGKRMESYSLSIIIIYVIVIAISSIVNTVRFYVQKNR